MASLQSSSIEFLSDHFRANGNIGQGARISRTSWTLQEMLESVVTDLDSINDESVNGFLETLLHVGQLVNGAVGGIAPAILIAVTGQPTAADEFVIDDGAGGDETYTFVAGVPGAFESQIGGTVALTMTNLVTSIMANSLLWNAYLTTTLDNFFTGGSTTQVVITRKTAVASVDDRVYASTLTGTGAIRVVDFVTNGAEHYGRAAANEGAIVLSDPGSGTFGIGRVFANLKSGEVHRTLHSAYNLAYTWEESGQTWVSFGVQTYSAADLGSTTGGSEGALLIGTDAKSARLQGATNVEQALDVIDLGPDDGSVATVIIIQSGQPIATETITIGADTYEADGAGANGFAIGGDAQTTMDNLLAVIQTNGTENIVADKMNPTELRLRSADAPNGTPIAADPSIVITYTLTNYQLDISSGVNMNTQAGRAAGASRQSHAELTISPDHVIAAWTRLSFPFTVAGFILAARDATGVPKALTETQTIDHGDILVSVGTGGTPLIATDVVTAFAWS